MSGRIGNKKDLDALAFITAAGIVDRTQLYAVYNLVNDLKLTNLWDKMKAIYPMVGGTANTHKWNLKDSRDLDTAFRLVFNGLWTHSLFGATAGGTAGTYAKTFFNNTNFDSINSTHANIYKTTMLNPATGWDFGNLSNPNNSALNLFRMNISSLGTAMQVNGTLIGITNSIYQGMFTINRIVSSASTFYINGNNIFSQTDNVSGTTNTNSFSFGSQFVDGFANNSNETFRFVTIGSGLSNNEMTTLYNIIQQYQTILNRQI